MVYDGYSNICGVPVDGESWTCLKCGSYFKMERGQLDEEELEGMRDDDYGENS